MKFNFNSIKAKIILSSIILSLVTVVIIGSISIIQSNNVVSKQIKDNLATKVQDEATDLSKITDKVENSVKSIGYLIQGTFKPNRISNNYYMKTYEKFLEKPLYEIGTSDKSNISFYIYYNVKEAKGLYGNWFAKQDGVFTVQDLGSVSDFDDINDPGYAWYFKPLTTGKGTWLDPYVDPDMKVQMISFAYPVIIKEKTVGIAGFDLSFADIAKFVNDINLYKDNKVILVNSAYNVLSDKNLKLNLNDNLGQIQKGKYKFLVDGSKNDKTGIIEEGNNITAFAKLDNGFVLFILTTKAEAFKEVNKLLAFLVLAMVFALSISAFAAYVMGNYIVKPIEELTKTSLQIADNDLTVQIQNIEDKSEIGELNRGFKKFVQNLKSLVAQIIISVQQLSEKTRYMSDAASHNIQQSLVIAKSICQISASAEEQANSIEESLANISKMDIAISKIAENAENTVKIAKDSENAANKGNSESSNAVDKINLICESVSKTKTGLVRFNTLTKQIEQIVDIIKNIAAQTNLISLNAAIEAARAGEHGKGFAVVANEVKELADKSAQSSAKIINMIKEIQIESKNLLEEMNTNEELVKEGASSVQSVCSSLLEIVNSTKTVENHIAEINSEIKNIASGSKEMVMIMQNISAVSEETATSVEEISQITENQKESIQEIGRSSDSLSETAKILEDHVKIFKI